MKELLRKHQEEIRRQVKNDLRHIFMENMALLQEQVKETQQELWNLHYPQQEDLFREDLKEMVCEEIKNSKIIMCPKEEPLPEASKGTADFQRTPRKQKSKKKYEGDHHSAPSHSENPSVQIEREIIDAQSVSNCMSLAELFEKDLQKAADELWEKYKYYICMKKEQPHSLRRRRQVRVKEMKPWKTYGTAISSFEHRVAALHTTAHVVPAPDVYLVIQMARVTWTRCPRLNGPIQLIWLPPLSTKEGNSTLVLTRLLVTELVTDTLEPGHNDDS
ncbi:hypothetical protein STEG23_016054 [Scotinomys teguina]